MLKSLFNHSGGPKRKRERPSMAPAELLSLSVAAVGLHKVRLDVGVGGPLRTLNKKLTRWGFRSFRVHLPSLSYDLGHGDVASHETAPIAMELSPHRGAVDGAQKRMWRRMSTLWPFFRLGK